MKIPIRNLYYLFSYAWAQFPGGREIDVGIDSCPDLQNLFGKVLVDGVHRLTRRGLDRGYRSFEEETRSPRGRLLMAAIIKEQTLRRGAVVCQFDELSYDVLHNQIIKATARLLAREPSMTRDLAHELRLIERKLSAITDIRLSGDCFRRVQLSRNTGQYGVLMKLCEFVFRCTMPEEGGSGSRFARILENEVQMSRVFEEFLRNFFAHEQSTYRLAPSGLQWASAGTIDQAALKYLPSMRTDVTLRSEKHVIVLDAKFYSKPFSNRYGIPKIHSANLYQLLTYLRHTAIDYPHHMVAGGLVYASVGEPVSLPLQLMGHPVRVEAVDLTMPWSGIRQCLLQILNVGTDPCDEQSQSTAVMALA